MSKRGWIGVDLDGTIAQYDHWRGVDHIGEPVPLMLGRVKAWIEAGDDVRIFTARVAPTAAGADSRDLAHTRQVIEMWCLHHIGRVLPVTCVKDHGLIQLWDDRAVGVVPNEGIALRNP